MTCRATAHFLTSTTEALQQSIFKKLLKVLMTALFILSLHRQKVRQVSNRTVYQQDI